MDFNPGWLQLVVEITLGWMILKRIDRLEKDHVEHLKYHLNKADNYARKMV